jgi:hypothetical protein
MTFLSEIHSFYRLSLQIASKHGRYVVRTNNWMTIQPLVQPRFDAAVCAYNGEMHVCGGQHKGVLSSVERYDVITNKRSVTTNMQTSRACAARCSLCQWILLPTLDSVRRRLLPGWLLLTLDSVTLHAEWAEGVRPRCRSWQ